MKIIHTKFKDLKIIKQDVFKDKRGSLRITFNQKLMKKKDFIFEYCTSSKKKSLRGFHFQFKHQQAKYVSVIKGKILDCVIDLRKNSKTFGKFFQIILSEKNNLGLYIPKGFAHAYYSYNNFNIIYYKLTNFYKPQFESGINLMDKTLDIKWPKKKFNVSNKDRKLQSFNEFERDYKFL